MAIFGVLPPSPPVLGPPDSPAPPGGVFGDPGNPPLPPGGCFGDPRFPPSPGGGVLGGVFGPPLGHPGSPQDPPGAILGPPFPVTSQGRRGIVREVEKGGFWGGPKRGQKHPKNGKNRK